MRLFAVVLMCLFSLPALAAGDAIKIERASTMERSDEIPTAGVFMIIENGGEADRLVGAKSSASDMVMMHSMDIDADGVMIMKHETSFDVPAGGTLVLAPGNNHIMMMDIKTPFDAGTSIPLTLVFEKAGEKTVAVEVIKADKLVKLFPPELSNKDLTKKMAEARKKMGAADGRSSLDALRERIQNFFRKDKKETGEVIKEAPINSSGLPTREEMENTIAAEQPPVTEPESAVPDAPAEESAEEPVDAPAQ